jgi:PEGA domain
MLLKLKPGKHRVQLVLKDYKDWLSDVEVKTGSIVNVTATLEK